MLVLVRPIPFTQNQYLNPWMLMGSLFIPVIPTHSANLAGTASILTQWWIGQGVEAFGFSGVGGNMYQFNDTKLNGVTDLRLRRRAAEKIRRFCPGPVLLQQPVVRQRRSMPSARLSACPGPGSSVAPCNWYQWTWSMASPAAMMPQTIQQMSRPCGTVPSRPSSSACSIRMSRPTTSR